MDERQRMKETRSNLTRGEATALLGHVLEEAFLRKLGYQYKLCKKF